MSKERYVWRIAFQNFIKSFRPRQIRGNHMGNDYLGNKYYEIPADPRAGKRKPVRWFDPPKTQEDYHQEKPLPSEWESWLRMRRLEPPTEEEINKNLAIAAMKKENAAKIEAKRLADGGSLPATPSRGPQSYPKYSEYHTGDPEGKIKPE